MKSLRSLFRATLVLACATLPMAAQAQTSTLSDTTAPVMFLKETVVTGARYPRRYYESPQALSFLSRSQLRDLAPTVIGDALQQLPGVDNSKDSPWEQRPILRGLSGQRVLVLMDGMPMNSARGNGPHPSLVDASQIERIEVVRGPSSVSYGSDAIGGVLNIITRGPRSAAELGGNGVSGGVTLGGSSVDGAIGTQVELRPRMGRMSAVLSGGLRDVRDFSTPADKVPNSSYNDWNGLASLRFEATDQLTVRAGLQSYRASDVGIPGLSFDSPGASQAFSFKEYDRDLVHLTLDQGYAGGWLENTRLRVYWQREQRDFFSDQDIESFMYNAFGIPNVPGSVNANTLQDRFFDLATTGAQLQLVSRRSQHYRWTAGLDFASDRTSGNNVRLRTYTNASGAVVSQSTRITQSVPDGTFANYGAYFQNDWFVSPRWTMSTGVRGTLYRYRSEAGPASPSTNFTAQSKADQAVCGSLGLVYAVHDDLHFSANVANGYRQPNAQDLYFNGPASVGLVLGDPDLGPEKSLSYDLGMRWGAGAYAFSANAFLSTYRDLIDAVAIAPSTYQYTNIATASIRGAELEAEASVLPGLHARASASYAVGDITSASAIRTLYGVTADRAPLGGVPPFKGNLSMRWSPAASAWWVESMVRGSWRTDRLPLPTPGVGQFTEFKKEWLVGDLTFGARDGETRFVAGVRNLTNRSYRQPLGSLDDPGRSYFVQFGVEF